MRLSCTLAAGALAAAAAPSCAFHVSGPAIVPASAKTSFTSTSAVVGRHAASATPARISQNVLKASLKLPGTDWVRGRKERTQSALVLKSGTDAAAPAPAAKEATSTLKVGFYLFVWYSLTIGYNIYNKATLNRIPIPWILSTVQLAVGTVYVSLIWALGVRKAPKLSADNLKAVLPLAALHTTSHIAAVVALSAGAIGFVQIVKVRARVEEAAVVAGHTQNSRGSKIYQQQVRWFFFPSRASFCAQVPPRPALKSLYGFNTLRFFSGALVTAVQFSCVPPLFSFPCSLASQQRQTLSWFPDAAARSRALPPHTFK